MPRWPKKDGVEETREVVGIESGDNQSQSTVKEQPLIDSVNAPVIIKELSSSDLPLPPESKDVQYLTREEEKIRAENNTLEYMHVPVEDGLPSDAVIKTCSGRDPETHKLIVNEIPARRVKILPHMVMQYLGSVVSDHLSVHTANFTIRKRRFGYTFDRFFNYNGQKLSRCCLVVDRVHQAALLYEKFTNPKTLRADIRLRKCRDERGNAISKAFMYRVIGAQETDLRDLKKLFERNFLRRDEEALADEIGLLAKTEYVVRG